MLQKRRKSIDSTLYIQPFHFAFCQNLAIIKFLMPSYILYHDWSNVPYCFPGTLFNCLVSAAILGSTPKTFQRFHHWHFETKPISHDSTLGNIRKALSTFHSIIWTTPPITRLSTCSTFQEINEFLHTKYGYVTTSNIFCTQSCLWAFRLLYEMLLLIHAL